MWKHNNAIPLLALVYTFIAVAIFGLAARFFAAETWPVPLQVVGVVGVALLLALVLVLPLYSSNRLRTPAERAEVISRLLAEVPELAPLLEQAVEINRGDPEKLDELLSFAEWLIKERKTGQSQQQ